MKHLIPLNRFTGTRYTHNPQLLERVSKVIDSGYWINGPEQKNFESSLAGFLGVARVKGVANGSDALEISMRSLGINSDSIVGIAANAGGYALIAARNIGCRVAFIDIRLDNGLIDIEDLKLMSNDYQLDLVVVTYLFGNTEGSNEIINFLNSINVPVLEDCAQALGSRVGDSLAGSLGTIASFSFYPTKNLGAIGDAGAIATKDPILASRVAEISQYGWTSRYRIENTSGMNSRLDEIQAAILNFGLPFVEEDAATRRNILNFYKSSHNYSNFEFVTESHVDSTAHLAVVRLTGLSRSKAMDVLLSFGIETGIHYPVLDCDQNAGQQSVGSQQLRNSRVWVENILTVPCFASLSESEVHQVAAALKEIG
jgi:aminotransferase EvaB